MLILSLYAPLATPIQGLAQSVIHAWTSGRSLPMAHRLRDLCIATGVSADWWLCLGTVG